MNKTEQYTDDKAIWEFTLSDGANVRVEYSLNFLNHLEFYGPVSGTGYLSQFTLATFAFDGTRELQKVKYRQEDVREYAGKLAQFLYDHRKHDLNSKKYRDVKYPITPEPLPLEPVFVIRQGTLFEPV